MNLIAWLQGGILALALGRPPVGISEPIFPVSASPLESPKTEEAPAPNADPFPSRTYATSTTQRACWRSKSVASRSSATATLVA